MALRNIKNVDDSHLFYAWWSTLICFLYHFHKLYLDFIFMQKMNSDSICTDHDFFLFSQRFIDKYPFPKNNKHFRNCILILHMFYRTGSENWKLFFKNENYFAPKTGGVQVLWFLKMLFFENCCYFCFWCWKNNNVLSTLISTFAVGYGRSLKG